MSGRASKRKLPPREEKQFKPEISKIAGKVFDDKTVGVLLSFINSRVIKSVDYPIAQGKEAMVFRATREDRHTGEQAFCAVKVFKYETSSFFKSMAKYVEGDPRFHIRGNHRAMVQLWARKEFANLKLCFNGGVSVPEPISHRENVVIMQFLGEEGVASPLLEKAISAIEDPKALFDEIIEQMRKMYSLGLVHADLSSFNIIVHEGKPYFIDVGQSVLLKHPRAQQFLEHDVQEIVNFFSKRGVVASFAETLERVVRPIE